MCIRDSYCFVRIFLEFTNMKRDFSQIDMYKTEKKDDALKIITSLLIRKTLNFRIYCNVSVREHASDPLKSSRKLFSSSSFCIPTPFKNAEGYFYFDVRIKKNLFN